MDCGCLKSCQCANTVSSTPICRNTEVAYVHAYDNDGCDVALVGDGLLMSLDGGASYTDGSLDKGQITLKPDNQSGIQSFLGTNSNDKVVSIGKGSGDGSTLVFEGGAWTVKPLTGLKNKFDSASMKGATRFAGVTCSASGIVELGLLNVTPSTYLYINAGGEYEPKTLVQLTENLLSTLCANTPAKLNTDVISTYYACTSTGKVVKTTLESTTVFLTTPLSIYSQNKTTGTPVVGGPLVSSPPDTPFTNGVFVTNFVDVNLAAISGYSDKAVSVLLLVRSGVAVDTVTNSWDMVCKIEGVDYTRIPVFASSHVDKKFIEVEIKIPTSKLIRVEGLRQNVSGTAGANVNEIAGLEVFLKAFRL